MKNIWCLFSIENNYDQPDNNLVTYWSQKPTEKEIKSIISQHYDRVSKQNCLDIFNGEEVRVGNTDYRIQEIKEGELINEK